MVVRACPRGDAREAEVEDLDVAIRAPDDVLRLEVAVDDAGVVSGGETGGDIGEGVEQQRRSERAAGQLGAQRFSFDQL